MKSSGSRIFSRFPRRGAVRLPRYRVARLDAEVLARASGDALDLLEDDRALALVDEPPPARPDEAEVHGTAELERLGGPRVDAAPEGGDLEDLEVRVGDADDPAGVHGDALARDRVVLEDQDAHAAPREEEGDREAIDPSAHDDDVPRAGRDPRVAPLEDLAFGHLILHDGYHERRTIVRGTIIRSDGSDFHHPGPMVLRGCRVVNGSYCQPAPVAIQVVEKLTDTKR